ncbi:hypothetical protein U9M48_031841 [Paspalum notatum var. saurae]|uniref:Uncharacterized protein n=1 Tax=Paspalum notatum var. saurae TaxID=547442 RepID=A0AAQ3U3X4_PASNO
MPTPRCRTRRHCTTTPDRGLHQQQRPTPPPPTATAIKQGQQPHGINGRAAQSHEEGLWAVRGQQITYHTHSHGISTVDMEQLDQLPIANVDTWSDYFGLQNNLMQQCLLDDASQGSYISSLYFLTKYSSLPSMKSSANSYPFWLWISSSITVDDSSRGSSIDKNFVDYVLVCTLLYCI